MDQNVDNVILAFSQQRPSWQQDLFRRALTQPAIMRDDLEKVLSFLRVEHGLELARTIVPEPLSSEHVRFREPAAPTTTILSISETQNVNRLIPDQELPFARSGITLIYGDNGSGKSGYSRILKQVCRARRDRPEKVLGDVYATAPPPPAQAVLTYALDGEAQTPHLWVDGVSGPRELSLLTVFDAQTAPIYVDRQNQIEFLPEGLDVLPRVGAAILEMASMLERDISPLADLARQPVLTVPAGTRTAALLDRLSDISLPTTEEIKAAAVWSEEDEGLLAGVRETLAKLAQPTKAAAKCQRMKAVLVRTARIIDEAVEKLNDVALPAIKRLQTEAHSAREAAKVSASDTFKDDPFGQHMGGETWRRLFRYAREFSEIVYPNQPFPVVGADTKCLLCQQPLSDIASDRFLRFNNFLEQNASREAEQAEREFSTKTLAITQLNIPSAASVHADLGEYAALGDDEQSIMVGVVTFCEVLTQRQRRLTTENIIDFDTPFIQLAEFSTASLTAAAQSLEAEAAGYDRMVQDESQRKTNEMKRSEMEARKLLHSELPRVLDRLKLIEKLRRLENCRAACDTTAISRKASSLRDDLITDDFQGRLRNEADKLGVNYLPLKIATRSERGASFVGIALDQTAGVRTASVLSEGEFRVLALACFLAEVKGLPGRNGIIIDDPVSSLDHRHIRQVARRLVEEVTLRAQIIIFTHNLPFYYELLEAAQEANITVEAHQIERMSVTDCGKVGVHDAPWQVKKVRERMVCLEELLKVIPKPENCSAAEYTDRVKKFYVPLRETWERLVEERLLNGVVGRFEPGVKTQSLKGVVVDDADYQKVFAAMAKASRYSGHDSAVSLQTSPPSPSEMRGDLDLLRNYEAELKRRIGQVEARRKALEDPIRIKSA